MTNKKDAAHVEINGLMGNYMVSFAGHIVATGLQEWAAKEYAEGLNKVSDGYDVAYKAIVIYDKR